jgi:hypothetical protein
LGFGFGYNFSAKRKTGSKGMIEDNPAMLRYSGKRFFTFSVGSITPSCLKKSSMSRTVFLSTTLPSTNRQMLTPVCYLLASGGKCDAKKIPFTLVCPSDFEMNPHLVSFRDDALNSLRVIGETFYKVSLELSKTIRTAQLHCMVNEVRCN